MRSPKTGLWVSAAVVIALIVGTFFWTRYLRAPTNVAYVSEEEGGISVIDLGKLKVIRRVKPNDVAPRGLAVTFDGTFLVTANKESSDLAVFSTPRLELIRRVHIGPSPEFIKINPAGNRLFATFEPGTKSGPPQAAAAPVDSDDTNEPPAQIASFHIEKWTPGPI